MSKKVKVFTKSVKIGFVKTLLVMFAAFVVLSLLNNGSAFDTIALRMPTSPKSFSIHSVSWAVLVVFVTDIIYAYVAFAFCKTLNSSDNDTDKKLSHMFSMIFGFSWLIGSVGLVLIYYFVHKYKYNRVFEWADLLNIYYTLAVYAVLIVAFLLLELIIEAIIKKIKKSIDRGAIRGKNVKFKITGFKNNGTVFPRLMNIDTQFADYREDFSIQDINLKEFCESFCKYLWRSKKYYTLPTVQAFVSGLANSRFLILRGNKEDVNCTDLPKFFAKFTGADCTDIEVLPSWRDEKDLIGFYNDYSKTFHATAFLTSVYKSTYRTNTMNLIVMDEINNARVEKYFAPVINQINSDKKIIDIQSEIDDEKYPLNAPFGLLDCADNNWFIGVEVRDEGKYRIPEKVYGIATVVDVRVCKVDEKVDYVKPIPVNYLSFIRAKKQALENAVLDKKELEFIDKLCAFMNEHFVSLDKDARENKYKNFLKMFYACGGDSKIGVNKNLYSLLTSYLDDSSIAVNKKDLKYLKSRLIVRSEDYRMQESIDIVDEMIERMAKD